MDKLAKPDTTTTTVELIRRVITLERDVRQVRRRMRDLEADRRDDDAAPLKSIAERLQLHVHGKRSKAGCSWFIELPALFV